MNIILPITEAMLFAAQRHVDQRRKGAAQEPYVNHLAEVAMLVAKVTGGRDPSLVIAAMLHDTLEDTPTSSGELATLFGEDVAGLVQEVTDDKSLPKAERKRLQVENAPSKSNRAKLIKLADKISNVRAMTISPPQDWSLERRRAYVDWAEAVVEGLKGVNSALENEFLAAVDAARTAMADEGQSTDA